MPQTNMQDVSNCPHCRRRVLLPPELVGQQVQCPGCGATFTAGDEARSRPAPETPIAPRPNYERWEEPLPMRPPTLGRRSDDYDEDDDGDQAHERRRRGRHRSEAIRAVSGPGTALQVVGGIAAAFAALMLFISCLGGIGNGRPGFDNQPAQVFGGVVPGILGICWGLIVLLGGAKMRALENYGSAMTGAIVAVIPCSLCWFFGLPFGIWAIAVLSRADVKEAFR